MKNGQKLIYLTALKSKYPILNAKRTQGKGRNLPLPLLSNYLSFHHLFIVFFDFYDITHFIQVFAKIGCIFDYIIIKIFIYINFQAQFLFQ